MSDGRNEKSLRENPNCRRCKAAPHAPGDFYCVDCSRIVRHKGPRKWFSRRTGLEWCKICGIRERLPYHHYCHLCKMEYQNRTRAKKWSERYASNDAKRIETARAYATNLLARGKIRRGPCAFCGEQGTQFHHYDYERKTRNFDDVCYECHLAAHKILRILLTMRFPWAIAVDS
jgi:hypothetical protein